MRKFASAVRTFNFATRTDAAQPFRYTKAEYITPVLLRKIAQDIKLTAEEFLKNR
ncbi:MAG: hypothetical protein WKF90_01730 [Pyrinomonadaceae bacterium]